MVASKNGTYVICHVSRAPTIVTICATIARSTCTIDTIYPIMFNVPLGIDIDVYGTFDWHVWRTYYTRTASSNTISTIVLTIR